MKFDARYNFLVGVPALSVTKDLLFVVLLSLLVYLSFVIPCVCGCWFFIVFAIFVFPLVINGCCGI